jgi:predicted GNAT family acetyltransferase
LAAALIRHIQAEAPGPLYLFTVAEEAGRLYHRAGFRLAGEFVETYCWLPG